MMPYFSALASMAARFSASQPGQGGRVMRCSEVHEEESTCTAYCSGTTDRRAKRRHNQSMNPPPHHTEQKKDFYVTCMYVIYVSRSVSQSGS